jgi:hypothetical protein
MYIRALSSNKYLLLELTWLPTKGYWVGQKGGREDGNARKCMCCYVHLYIYTSIVYRYR